MYYEDCDDRLYWDDGGTLKLYALKNPGAQQLLVSTTTECIFF